MIRSVAFLLLFVAIAAMVSCDNEQAVKAGEIRVGMPLAEAQEILAEAGADETLWALQLERPELMVPDPPVKDFNDRCYELPDGKILFVWAAHQDDGEFTVDGLTLYTPSSRTPRDKADMDLENVEVVDLSQHVE